MKQEDTQSVRISKKMAKEVKMHVAQYGGTIRRIVEDGLYYAMGKSKKDFEKKNKIVS